jgi:L,D-peptidoglycan transpeptidase YkuD (ErfK/YbiS/YcfS/YnhG family)
MQLKRQIEINGMGVKVRAPRKIIVMTRSAACTTGRLVIGPISVPCALGRSGLSHRKREGDGATPAGLFGLRRLFYRADQGFRPRTGLHTQALKMADGWCDASRDPNYNRLVQHPYPASAEQMWRGDRLYDVVIVIGHNDRPRVTGAGSAIFMHIARDGFKPTEGCIAVRAADMRRILPLLSRNTEIVILGRANKANSA